MLDLDPFFGDIHPSASFTPEVLHIEAFEPIIFQLGMLRCQAYSFNLQSEAIQLGVAGAKNLSIRVGGNEKESVFIDSVNAFEDIFQIELAYFGDVFLFAGNIKIILRNCIHLVLISRLAPISIYFFPSLLPDCRLRDRLASCVSLAR